MDAAVPGTSAVLVRIPVTHDPRSWALPATPAMARVTATTSPRCGYRCTAALSRRGYVVVGAATAGVSERGAHVDVYVPANLRDAHPRWFDALLTRASRAFDCDLGPVQMLFGAELALHQQGISTLS